MSSTIVLYFIILLLGSLGEVVAEQNQGTKYITLLSTTSTEDSGLYDAILPVFTKDTGINVRVIAVGTGQAIKMAERGDGDVLLVHDTIAEMDLVNAGYVINRHDVMYNYYVLIGLQQDTIGKEYDDKENTINTILQHIYMNKKPFISRGDDSGTDRREKSLWKMLALEPWNEYERWYMEVGAGMGASLNIAVASGATILSDIATWLAFGNKKDHVIVYGGYDKVLLNMYGVMVVNPDLHGHVRKDEAESFVKWITSDEGKQEIIQYKVDGEQLFFVPGQ